MHSRADFEVRVDPGRLLRPLLGVTALLVALSYAGQVAAHGLELDVPGLNTWLRYTDVDREANLPAWFQSMLLAANAMLVWSVGNHYKALRHGWVMHWRLLAVAMAYLSVDELTEIHEQAIVPLQKLLGVGGFLYFAWITLAVPMLLIFGLVFLRFLLALPRATLRGLLLAFALYAGGAIGLEMVGGQLFSTIGPDTMLYATVASIEETLEMLGMTALLVVTARHQLVLVSEEVGGLHDDEAVRQR